MASSANRHKILHIVKPLPEPSLFMVNLASFSPAYLASRMVVQIDFPINRVSLVLLGSLLGYWPEPSASLEGGFAFKGRAFHSVKERIMQRMVKPPRMTMKHSFILQKPNIIQSLQTHNQRKPSLFQYFL